MRARTASEWRFREAVKPGIAAVRASWPTLVLIQAGAVALVTAYYRAPALREAAQGASDLKVRFGVWFSFVLGTLAGGLVPETAKLLTGGLRRLDRTWLGESAYNAFVYGIVGVQVDLFYRLQARMFGPTNQAHVLLLKTLVDMGAFATIISIPTATLLYAWRRNGLAPRDFAPHGWRAFYVGQVVPGLIPCWFFWTPVLLCTYAMPVNLQLIFSMLAEAAWSIVFVFIAKRDL